MRWRREDIPDHARASLGLRPRERVLAAARDGSGGWLAATEFALVGAGLRIAWVDIAHVRWLDEDRFLIVDPVPGAFAPARFALADPGRLPEVVHERVMASIVVSRTVALPGGGEARVVGRDDGSGELVWQVVPGAGVDPTDATVRRTTNAAVASLRGELGR
ncbi:MAG: hypothetical protein ACRDWY_11785 [Actinomycetes bacterium]